MSGDVVIVLDCGATNIRAIAVDPAGQVKAKAAMPNATVAASENPAWHVWPLEAILHAFATCCRRIRAELVARHGEPRLRGGFGVDGALVDAQGGLLYPIISWKCPRTAPAMEAIGRRIDPALLQVISGVGAFSFNTIYKLVWLAENRPELLRRAHAWLFISSLINHRLTGRFTPDATMAGTSQMFDLAAGTFSKRILDAVGVPASLFPELVAAGQVIGPLLPGVAELARSGFGTGAATRNWASYSAEVSTPADWPDWQRGILCDPQTSGGLLIAAASDAVGEILALARRLGFEHAAAVGTLDAGPPHLILGE
jgi:L-fuculokinase